MDEAVAGVDGVAGSDTYVQFNDGGNFGGDSAFTWESAADKLTVASGATTGDALVVVADSITSGSALDVSTASAGLSNDLVHFEVTDGAGRALFIEHTGTTGEAGSSIQISRYNNGRAMTIEAANTTQNAVWPNSDTIVDSTVLTVKGNSAAMTGSGYVLHAIQDNAAASGHAIVAQQDGDGNAIRGVVSAGARGANAGFFNQGGDSDSSIGRQLEGPFISTTPATLTAA